MLNVPVALSLILALPLQSQAPPAGTASLKARVIAADTGTAVRRASVRVDGNSYSWIVTTDDEGRFVLADLPAGRYTVRVTTQGFLPWLFGREPAGSMSRVEPIEIREGQILDRGDLRLPRGSVIAGRIVDEFGEPVIGIDVRALRLNYLAPGEPRLDYVRHGITNDLGEYRIFGLAPGRYFVGIGLSTQEAAQRTDQGSPTLTVVASRQGVAPRFYPGTAVATEATPVVIEPGGTAANIDIQQRSVPLATVSGTVTNSRGAPATDSIVMLNPARADRVLFTLVAFIEPQRDGGFRFVNIPPGDYRLDVVPKARLEAIGQTGPTAVPRNEREEIASVPIVVSGQDVDGVAVRTARGFSVEGRVRLEGGAVLPPKSKIMVTGHAATRRQGMSGAFFGASGLVQPDGRFILTGVASRLIFGISSIPQDWALKSITLNGVDVTDVGLDVQNDVRSIEILLTPTPSHVTATVTDASGAAVQNYAAVVVFSSDNARWTTLLTRYVRSSRPSGGTVTIAGLPAGDYFAAAVDILEPDWASPAQLDALRRTATAFTLADGERKALTLVRR